MSDVHESLRGKPVVVQPNEMSDDEILNYTQGIRKQFIEHVTSEGFPSKPREQEVFLSALADMDRVATNNKRIGASERASAADMMVAQTIMQVTEHFGAANPFERGGSMVNGPLIDPARLPEPEPVPGETDVGISGEKYDEFIERVESK